MMTYSTLPRKAGKRGARKSARRPERFLSQWRTIAGPVEVVPISGDVSHGITDWGMDGNADLSDCVEAATDHYNVAKTGDVQQIGKLGGVGPVPLYGTYGQRMGEPVVPPATIPDQGTDPRSWLDMLVDLAVIDEWGELDNPNDVDAVHQAMLDFNGVLICVDLTDDAEQLFEAHQPWTIAGGESSDPNDGHGILLVAYGPQGDQFVTWGGLQWATVAWDSACITAAFVIIDADDPTVDVAGMKAYIANMGIDGNPPATSPSAPPSALTPPGPFPAPPAPLPDTHAAWWNDVQGWLVDVEHWVSDRIRAAMGDA